MSDVRADQLADLRAQFVGQVVLLARHDSGATRQTLTIPRGRSAAAARGRASEIAR